MLEKLFFFVPGIAVFGRSPQATARPSLCEALPGGVGEADCREGKQPSGDNPLDCADDNPLDCAGDGHK
ncbi:hypothetical protein [Mesorhizobium sp.]|uniref:hypothetical protein n=1 Tax=Mesorhizobium sp. TaxID=1871066 RepID=UPI000FE9CA2F|nr:hypothetical protein [Mesorhizobium sp.]RWC44228.1 MAG: hypothetical protein EOS28_09295 [Mesorhizobium sp.]RWE98530.1 MAG: hypothetical protein EOS68_13590 [Mesorhizobium sp.]